jgi:hypothetical protein
MLSGPHGLRKLTKLGRKFNPRTGLKLKLMMAGANLSKVSRLQWRHNRSENMNFLIFSDQILTACAGANIFSIGG